MNPEDFIITRKRKKYKFALFANSPLCFEYDDWKLLQDNSSVKGLSFNREDNLQHFNDVVDVIEIGAGTGQFVVELAARHPDVHYVAVDVKADRLQKGAAEATARGLTNVRFLRARADQLVEIFPPDSVQEIWLTFSDPFPRDRSAGRRLTHPGFLAQYQQLLAANGSLFIKHDNPAFFQWTLEQLVAEKWHITELSFDLHESELSVDYKILTPYERRWLDEGRITQLVVSDRA